MIITKNIKRDIILASASPRRRQILEMLGINFSTAKSGVENEDEFFDLNDLDNSLRKLAEAKAESAAKQNKNALVLGADTTVFKNGEVFNKPENRQDAARMLRALSGTEHTVITAVALRCDEKKFCESVAVRTKVFFRELCDGDIENYLDHGEYADKAGAYAVQGVAMAFIHKIDGCFYNVMGLPVSATIDLFNAFMRKEVEKCQ